jgi:hemerythrin
MSTGIARIDNQHQELIRKLNALLDAMQKGRGKEEIAKLLGFLGEYVIKHFSDEEAEMERLQCPAAVANRIAHQQFIKRFTDFRNRFEKEGAGPRIIIEVQKSLVDWVVMHIRGVDTKLAASVKQKVASGT